MKNTLIFTSVYLILKCVLSTALNIEYKNYTCTIINLTISELDENNIRINENHTVANLKLETCHTEKLGSVFCDKMPSIVEFNAEHSSISIVEKNAFQKCSKLKVLNIYGNNIIYLDVNIFKNNSELTQLWLNENKLEYVDDDLFKNIKKLEILQLHSNRLTQFNLNFFPVMKELRVLSIHGNNLKYFNNDLWPKKFPNLKKLYLFAVDVVNQIDKNNFSCTNERDLRTTLKNMSVKVLDSNMAYICTPDHLWRSKCLTDPECVFNFLEEKNSQLKQDILNLNADIIMLKNYIKSCQIYLIVALIVATVINVAILIQTVYEKKKLSTQKLIEIPLVSTSFSSPKPPKPLNHQILNFNDKDLPDLPLSQTLNEKEAHSCTDLSINESINLSTDVMTVLKMIPKQLDLQDGPTMIFEKIVGVGHYGIVFQAQLLQKDTNRKVAAKLLRSEEEFQKENFNDEFYTMKKLNHPNVVKFIKILHYNRHLFIIMELIEGGSLLDYLRKERKMLLKQGTHTTIFLLNIAKNISEGLEYLFKSNIIHRDLAARNVLLDGSKHAKICDFGLARFCNIYGIYTPISNNQPAFPWRWHAPESNESQIYSKKSDVWSFGVTMYEIFSYGEIPFKDIDTKKDLLELINDNVKLNPDICRIDIYNKLMLPCWNINPDQRPEIILLKENINHLINKYMEFKCSNGYITVEHEYETCG